jgi:hypothetical protein
VTSQHYQKRKIQNFKKYYSQEKSRQNLVLASEIGEKASAIPLSVFKKESGITNQNAWKPSKFNVLGQWEDYEEMERLHRPQEAILIEEEQKAVEKEIKPIPQEIKLEVDQISAEEEQKRKEWLEKLNVFQKYKEVREEHALDNWKRHSVEWLKVEHMVAKKAGKDPEDLLMARLGEFRQKLEEKQLIEEAVLLLEEQNINFWKEGMRIGNDLLGLCVQLPKGGPRQIERLHYNERKLKKTNVTLSAQGTVKNQTPTHQGEYLELVGQGLHKVGKDLAQAYVERLEKLQSRGKEETSDLDVDQHKEEQERAITGMKLVASTKRLFYEVVVGQISTSVMTIYNQGSVAIHFEWTPVKKKNPLNTKLGQDGKQRFFMNYVKGVIRPGTAFDFPIVFQSSTPGIYSETWRLSTSPVSKPDDEIYVTLFGVSYQVDTLKEKRDAIDTLLRKRRAQTVASETMRQVLKRVQSAQNRLDTPPKDKRKRKFEERNKLLRLHYHPDLYDQLVALSEIVYNHLQLSDPWNGSVTVLSSMISQMTDNTIRAECLSKLNRLVNESTKDVISGRTLMCVISNEILTNLAMKVVDLSEDLRKKMNLPPVSLPHVENPKLSRSRGPSRGDRV